MSVFYDLKNPNKFLSDVEEILDENGIFLLEFADLASIIKLNMFDTLCHEHLEYYSLKVVDQMCKKNKLRIFDIKSNNINGGSVQIFICKKNSKYLSNLNTVHKQFSTEKKLKLDKKITFIKFFKRINKIKKDLLNFLKKEKIHKKKIHCYGASTKGNVLLQYFNIDSNIIDYVAERNPKKYNLFTPGSKIKIISEKKSREMLPDYYLVLPWHFKTEILKRERLIRKNGTKFIFPLPKININS